MNWKLAERPVVALERWPIPDSWRWKSLDEIGVVIGGGTPSTREPANFDPDGVPWITPADLSGFTGTYVSGGKRALSQRGVVSSRAVPLPAGAVLFSSRAPIGYCVIAENEIATSQGFKNLLLNPAMSSEYVREYLAGSVDYAESQARGTTFKELSRAKFSSLRIPVAPPEEQLRIAQKFTQLRRLLSTAEAEIDRARRASSRLRAAILRSAFSGELTRNWRQRRSLESSEELVGRTPGVDQPSSGRRPTDRIVEGGVALRLNGVASHLPVGWSWQPLLRLARQESGHTPSRAIDGYWNGDIPWVGVRDAGEHHGRIINSTLQRISQSGLNNSSARMLPSGSVLLCRTAASIGYVCQLGQPMATSQDFVAWICGPALNPSYLMYLMMGERDFLKRLGRGTAHPTVYLPEIRAFSIALAPLDEQAEIVAQLNAAFERLTKVEKEIDAAAEMMPNFLQRLHNLAFRGQLVPQTIGGSDVDIALGQHAGDLQMKMQKRRSSERDEPRAKEKTLAEQLAARYDVWPDSGHTFEDLRETLSGSYDEIRGAIFSALREEQLVQQFDARRRLMVFVKGQK